MDKELIKQYLQGYLKTVIEPNVNSQRDEKGLKPMQFDLYDILKGSYDSQIIHVFLDSEPSVKKGAGLKPHTIMMMDRVQKDIINFLKIFSITNKVKVHWNQRPLFNNETLSSDY